jgi:bacteriocin biosynthesis cyclodehydratase domain-containing protein
VESVAPAVRIEPLGIIAVDAFGRYAARHAQACAVPGEVVILPEPPEEGGVRVLALLAGRPVPGIARNLDAFAFSTGTPFVVIWLTDGRLQVGPVVVPGAGPCFGCFEARERQHAPGRDAVDAIRAHQAATLPADDVGVLLPLARLAGAEVLRLCGSTAELATIAGAVWAFSVPPTLALRGKVVGLDGCVRCGQALKEWALA